MTKTIRNQDSIEQQILDEMRIMNVHLAEQTTLLKQSDWKLWILSNAIIDAMLDQGTLKVDPRKK